MLARARTRVARDNVHFVRADLRAPWPLADQSADVVVANLVLEHIESCAFLFAGQGKLVIDCAAPRNNLTDALSR